LAVKYVPLRYAVRCNNQQYRLVYRIYDKPIPKRVKIISFDVHDPAYEKAQQRVS
jgi:Txe/YoeB family toxin of Txe-Axe toxin-antitoxin module